jgi:phosphoglucomutase
LESADLLNRMSTPQVVRILVEAYQNSQYAMEARARIQEIVQIVRTTCMATV